MKTEFLCVDHCWVSKTAMFGKRVKKRPKLYILSYCYGFELSKSGLLNRGGILPPKKLH